MKRAIFITGANGSGKSEVGRKLQALGYESYDIDTILDLCVMVDRATHEPTVYDNGNDVEKMERMYWWYRKDKLKEFILDQKSDVAFYCGSPNNVVEIIDLFDTVMLLIASPENIRQRLSSRKDNGFGKSIEVQNYILNRKENMEKNLMDRGAISIDADQEIDKVIKDIVSNLN